MNLRILAALVCFSLSCTPELEDTFSPVDALSHIDPLIGSAGGGFAQPQVFVGAATPFGMVRLGPDTAGDLPRAAAGFAHTSGYWFVDGYIEGFSHLHLSGTGIEDFGNILVMPSQGMAPEQTREEGYRQAFAHEDEVAEPGYYRVQFRDSGIQAELTASPHAGLHRYTFPSGTRAPTLIIDVSHGIGRNGATAAQATLADGCVKGEMWNAGRFTGEERAFPVYYSLCFNHEIRAAGVFRDEVITADQVSVSGENIGMYVQFDDDTEVVEVAAGISLIDLAQARVNRSEVEQQPFTSVVQAAKGAWGALVNSVRVQGGTDEERRIFFSGLYRSALMPTLYSESGRYRGLDRQVHDDDGIPYYSDLSMWDTYRTAHPLYALLWPQQASAFSTSILRMAQEFGSLPRWPLAVNETGTMLGTPASIILADTWLRGAQGFDIDTALMWMRDDADSTPEKTSRLGHAACFARGFCAREDVSRSVAHAIEWSAADFALAQVLEARGEAEASARYHEQSMLFLGNFDDETGFLRGRSQDGRFDPASTFDATEFSEDYAEGNAWQYLFAAPFGTEALAARMGGVGVYVDKARELFELTQMTPPRYLTDDIRQPDPYYWHGNEPDLHAALSFSLVGDADETARWVDFILRERYDDTPWGLEGNDDAGTLSAWYVLAALGLFPIPGSEMWVLTPPRFSVAEVARPQGPLRIVTEREDASSIFLKEVWLDDTKLDDAVITHTSLTHATSLRFVMSAIPSGFAKHRR